MYHSENNYRLSVKSIRSSYPNSTQPRILNIKETISTSLKLRNKLWFQTWAYRCIFLQQ